MKPDNTNKTFKICMLSYRSNPHCGGQGVYLKNLTRALTDLGHHVEVLAGPPDPRLDSDITVHRIPCLDLYNPDHLFRIPTFKELRDPINLLEWAGVSTMGFPEPFTFGLRAYQWLRTRFNEFDVVHDNQSLSYGVWAMSRRIPTVATIHHPITVDRNLAVNTTGSYWKKLKHIRWHSFISMQKRISTKLNHIITVSKCARNDIARDFSIPRSRFRIVMNGINTELFRPRPDIERAPNRLIVTNSADIPLKGLYHLLKAVFLVARKRPVKLVVIGSPKKNGGILRLVRDLGIENLITFTGRVNDEEFVRQYARATAAVIPSMYEGFGLPAGEAMSCGVPVISTTGGALPEVVGNSGLLVPPADPEAISEAVIRIFDNPEFAGDLGREGYKRVHRMFTWEKAAKRTISVYRKAIHDHG